MKHAMKSIMFVLTMGLATALSVWILARVEINWHTPDYFELARDPGWDGVERYISPETMSPLARTVARIPLKFPAITILLLVATRAVYLHMSHKEV